MTPTPLRKILYTLGSICYGLQFLVIRPFDIPVPLVVRVLMFGLMMLFVGFNVQDLIQQQRAERAKWATASEEEKKKRAEQRKFAFMFTGLILLIVGLLITVSQWVGK